VKSWTLPLLVPATWILLAIWGSQLALNPDLVDLGQILQPPAASAWLGYDDLGRPVLDRLLDGARTSLLVALAVTLLSASQRGRNRLEVLEG